MTEEKLRKLAEDRVLWAREAALAITGIDSAGARSQEVMAKAVNDVTQQLLRELPDLHPRGEPPTGLGEHLHDLSRRRRV